GSLQAPGGKRIAIRRKCESADEARDFLLRLRGVLVKLPEMTRGEVGPTERQQLAILGKRGAVIPAFGLCGPIRCVPDHHGALVFLLLWLGLSATRPVHRPIAPDDAFLCVCGVFFRSVAGPKYVRKGTRHF